MLKIQLWFGDMYRVEWEIKKRKVPRKDFVEMFDLSQMFFNR